VYDIAMSGPRSRYTILTDAGPIIVHNCGYYLGWASFAQQLLTGFLGAPPVRYDRKFAQMLGVTRDDLMGFMEGKPGAQRMARMVEIPHTCTEEELFIHCVCAKRIIDTYRATAAPVTQFWRFLGERLEHSLFGGEVYEYKCVRFEKETIVLPNGMALRYPDLKPEKQDDGSIMWTYAAGAMRKKLHSGVLAENVTSALARVVKSLLVRNDHASAANTITLLHTDGTTAVNLYSVTLAAGESFVYEDDGFTRFSANGVELNGTSTGAPDVQVFNGTSGTWTKPAGARTVIVEAIGGGGGGGAGASLATAVVAKGGGGGGGGGWRRGVFAASDLGATVTVTIGNGGTAGARGAAGAAGGNGGAGGNTTFGSFLTAYGGGGGAGGAISAAVTGGGGGGGAGGAGGTGSTSGGAGGLPTAATNGAGGQGVTGSAAVSTTSNAEYGGGGGAGIAATPVASSHGGGSIRGGGGGGAGGSHSATPTNVSGGNGGRSGAYAASGGGNVGTDGASPTAGANGAGATSAVGGSGGGGGGTTVTASTNGGDGGNGGTGGGGGGGGGVGMNPGLGGNGGAGGAGYLIVYTY
jgi:hypothetical protein